MYVKFNYRMLLTLAIVSLILEILMLLMLMLVMFQGLWAFFNAKIWGYQKTPGPGFFFLFFSVIFSFFILYITASAVKLQRNYLRHNPDFHTSSSRLPVQASRGRGKNKRRSTVYTEDGSSFDSEFDSDLDSSLSDDDSEDDYRGGGGRRRSSRPPGKFNAQRSRQTFSRGRGGPNTPSAPAYYNYGAAQQAAYYQQPASYAPGYQRAYRYH